MKDLNNELNAGAVNTNNLHNDKKANNAELLITRHKLSSLTSNQILEHPTWMVEHQGRNIAKASLSISSLEDTDAVYLTLKPLSIYVDEEYRNQGIASSLIKEATKDAAFLIRAELKYQDVGSFRFFRGDGAEVISMHLDIDASFNSEAEEALAHLFSKSMNYQLESEIAELPYFVRTHLNIVEGC